jgi:FkbM family methyltransferase
MGDSVEIVKYKLMRARQLATLRYARWLFIRRTRPSVSLTTLIDDGVTIQYLPLGNVSRDLYMGQFERDIINFLVYFLKPGMTVFDVGANIGIYSLLSAKYVGGHGSVHAFEPSPNTFAQLQVNVGLNAFTCIHLIQSAVREVSATSMLYLYEQNAMNSLSRQEWVGKPLGQVEVQTVSLDEYVSTQELAHVDLLKVDVEGAELAVLQGARRLLSGSNPPVVVCEFADKTARAFGYQAASIQDYLERFGYQLFRWDSRTRSLVPEPRRPNYRIYANLVCIRSDDAVHRNLRIMPHRDFDSRVSR